VVERDLTFCHALSKSGVDDAGDACGADGWTKNEKVTGTAQLIMTEPTMTLSLANKRTYKHKQNEFIQIILRESSSRDRNFPNVKDTPVQSAGEPRNRLQIYLGDAGSPRRHRFYHFPGSL
jgi:hypothetical protein